MAIRDLTTNTIVPSTTFSFGYDVVTNIATLTLNTSDTQLANGNYRLEVSPGAVTDLLGRANASLFAASFFVLAGDANRDRTVDFEDLLILAQNYGQSNRSFSGGNFDYSADGEVSFADLLVLAQNYSVTVLQTAARYTARSSMITPDLFARASRLSALSWRAEMKRRRYEVLCDPRG